MSDSYTISMINKRGRVVWIEQEKLNDLLAQGWRQIVNPKEQYYPQYDQSLNKPKVDESSGSMQVLENGFENVLGIVVV